MRNEISGKIWEIFCTIYICPKYIPGMAAESSYEILSKESPILFLFLSTEITLTSTLCPTCGFGPCPI